MPGPDSGQTETLPAEPEDRDAVRRVLACADGATDVAPAHEKPLNEAADEADERDSYRMPPPALGW